MTEQREPGSDVCLDRLDPSASAISRPVVTGDWTCAAIALGGNLGNSQKILTEAIAVINCDRSIRVLKRSHFYKTAPIGPPQPDYLNACILIETVLTPRSLLQHLLAIENQFGRVRQVRWGARSLDLDLLLYGDQVVDAPGLTIPHPRLHERAFVLVPLRDVSPHWPHPIFRKTVSQLLDQLTVSGVERLASVPINL
ncbi:MAG: 2-amino-4-hydroxy-6-hydroxymethyldihydropteridine diphosphokinase [Cyanobacteria bacterium J06555_13]